MILIINELLQLYDLFGPMYYAIGIMEMLKCISIMRRTLHMFVLLIILK